MSSSSVLSITTGQSVSETAPVSVDLCDKARTLNIRNSIEYIQACEEKLAIDEMIKDRHAVHDPAVAKAYESHQAACRARNTDIVPLEEAKRLYTLATDRWRREQEQIAIEAAREEQRKIERQAEEAREAEIVEAEQAGATVVEVQAIAERPVYVPPVMTPKVNPMVPKVAGIRKRPDNWKARLNPSDPASLRKLILFVSTNPQFEHLLQLNESSANALAKGLKTQMAIPGLIPYNDSAL
jgi:hypothetical protein